MGRTSVLVVLCALAQADDLAEDVRKFIDERRNPAFREFYETVIDDAPAPPADRLHLEYRTGNHLYSYGLLSMVRRGDDVDLLRVRVRVADPGLPLPPRWEPGVEVSRATVPRAEFDRLLRKLALVEAARLRPRPGVEADGERDLSFAISGIGRLYLRVGDAPPVEDKLEPGGPEAVISDTIDERGRALLLFELVCSEAALWPAEEADTKAVSTQLAGDLADVEDWRRRLRVVALGYLGRAEALPALAKLAPDDFVDAALTQIGILGRCEGAAVAPAELVSLVAHGHPLLDPWAGRLLRTRFPDGYVAAVRARLDSEDAVARVEALRELESLVPADAEPARRALKDRDARVRVEAARILGDAEALLAMVRDKTLEGDEAYARSGAITYLTWLDPPRGDHGWREPPGDRDVVGKTLIAILRDESYGFDLRSHAAEGLGNLGYEAAIPDLLAVFGAGPTRHELRWDLPGQAASALGELRAQQAVLPMIRALQRRAGDPAFQSQVGIALAQIGAARALPVLRQQREIDRRDPNQVRWWDQSIALLEAIQRRDAMTILRGARGSSRFASRLLADTFTEEELRDLAKRSDLGDRRMFVERAVQLKEGR